MIDYFIWEVGRLASECTKLIAGASVQMLLGGCVLVIILIFVIKEGR